MMRGERQRVLSFLLHHSWRQEKVDLPDLQEEKESDFIATLRFPFTRCMKGRIKKRVMYAPLWIHLCDVN